MMKMSFHSMAAAMSGLLALAVVVPAQAQQRGASPERIGPGGSSYGPGVYTEGGVTVHVPRHCYVSREQVRIGGQLVWRPLVTCPYDEFR